MITRAIRKYFLGCPLIKNHQIRIDYLGLDSIEYTIDPVPSDPIIKKYVDGGALKQFLFVFGSRESYGPDIIESIERSGFYQKLSEWIEEQNRENNLPILSGNKKAEKIEIVTSGYLFDASEDLARYQIQLRLVYYED